MAVLREMAVRALQPLFGMNVHQMHGLAWIGADGNELPLPLPAPFFRIVRRHDLAVRVEQIALPVALEHAPEIPALALIVRELRFLRLVVPVVYGAPNFQVRPFAAWARPFRTAPQPHLHLPCCR